MSLVGGTAGLLVGALSASLVGHQLGYWSASPDISVAAPTAPFSKSEPEPEWTVPESPKWEPPLKPAPAPAPEPPSSASSEEAASASWVAPALVTVAALAAAGGGGKWAVDRTERQKRFVATGGELCPDFRVPRGRSPSKGPRRGSVGDTSVLDALAAAEYRR